MAAPRPTFRVTKKGYDRFAVDDAVDKYAAQVDSLEKKLKLYQQQMNETNARMAKLEAQYKQVVSTMDARQQSVDDIGRLSLREANEIIDTAQKNADAIIREALNTARLLLTDLSELYGEADTVKSGVKQKMEGLIAELDSCELPKMPDLTWLREAEKKMR